MIHKEPYQSLDLSSQFGYVLTGVGDIGQRNRWAQSQLSKVPLYQLRQVVIDQGVPGVVGVDSFSGIAVDTLMNTLVGTRRRDIDNPAVEALAFRMRVGEIVEGGAFLGY
jgi:hypothetical protein